MSDNVRLILLEEKVKSYNTKIKLMNIAIIAYIIIVLVVSIGTIIHWVKFDTLTWIQIVKWSLSTYWWAYLYIIYCRFFLKYKIKAIHSARECYLRDLYKEKKKIEENIKKAEETSVYK